MTNRDWQERQEKELREANTVIMIAKMWRGGKTRGAFKRELRQEAKAAGYKRLR